MILKSILLASVLLSMAACSQGPDSPRGFSLPKGDSEAGKQVFMQYQCMACHDVAGVDRASLDDDMLQLPRAIPLGGETTRVTTYAELVTAIINPSHKISRGLKSQTTTAEGKSKMPSYNDVMTIAELIDLVAYLQPKYEVKPVTYTHYGQYRPPH